MNGGTTLAPGITFAVHSVEPKDPPLRTCKTHESLASLVGGRAEACCDYTTDCVAEVRFNPLLAAVDRAFSDHLPLVLSPDMIWVVILQGLGQHVKNHPEQLRDRFVSHVGRKVLSVFRTDLALGSPENPWPEVVRDFSAQVHVEIGSDHAWLAADFSTTGPVERVAADVALLDAMQPYFEYRVYCICGIPAVTLEGTAEDWLRLAEKVDRLESYDLGWWLEHLRPVARQFARAAAGDVDLDHWRNIYKRLDAYGGDYANGWVVKLFPYLKNGLTGNYTEVNPLLQERFTPYPPAPAVPRLNRSGNRFHVEEPAVYIEHVPSGVSAAPFTFETADGRQRAMEFLGGFVGLTQDVRTLALRPKLGWAVRRRPGLDQLLLRVRDHRAGRTPSPGEFDATFGTLRERLRTWSIPGDFISFYKAYDGADLFADAPGGPVYRLRPLAAVEPVRPRWPADFNPSSVDADRSPSFAWLRIADLADGSYLALNFHNEWVEPDEPMDEEERWQTMREREVFLVIRCREAEPDPRRAYRVVAWSFAEFLANALSGGERPFFDEPGFRDRGDAFSTPRWAGPLPNAVKGEPYRDPEAL